MKLVPVLVLAMGIAMTALGCCTNRITQRHLWSEKQIITAIDQDPGRQDTWAKKEFGTDLFLVVDQDGNYIKR